MITKKEKERLIDTLAANVAAASIAYRDGLINQYAYDTIKNNSLTLASMHLDSFKELNNKLVEMGI